MTMDLDDAAECSNLHLYFILAMIMYFKFDVAGSHLNIKQRSMERYAPVTLISRPIYLCQYSSSRTRKSVR